MGLLVLGGGIAFLLVMKNTVANYQQVIATITDIDRIQEYTYVDYTFNGVAYTHINLNSYSSAFMVGNTLTIYVNPAKPEEIEAALSANVFPYVLIGFGSLILSLSLGLGIGDIVNRSPFVPARNAANACKARLTGVTYKQKGAFRLNFSVHGDSYHSGVCRGDPKLVETLLSKHQIDVSAYLDLKGRFAPNYRELDATLWQLKKADKILPTPDYHGLSPNDNGSNRF